MKKYLILLLVGLVIFTGCGKNNKKDEPKKEEKKEVVIETSPNVNFDLIDDQYKETLDEYLKYVPMRKIDIFSNDAYSGKKLSVDKASNGLLAISSADVYKRKDPEIKSCGEDIETCAICFDSNNCILRSEMVEKLDLYYNKSVLPSEIMKDLYSKLDLDIEYTNDVLKISKVLSFNTNDNEFYIIEQAAFAYKNGENVDVYNTTEKDEKILSIKSNKIDSKEVINEVLNNIDKFNKFKHIFKSSNSGYYWYSTEVE